MGRFGYVIPDISDDDFQRHMLENTSGCDPSGRGKKSPEPTRTTSRPFAETPQRKPYMPTTDTSQPSLDDGVSFRQSLED